MTNQAVIPYSIRNLSMLVIYSLSCMKVISKSLDFLLNIGHINYKTLQLRNWITSVITFLRKDNLKKENSFKSFRAVGEESHTRQKARLVRDISLSLNITNQAVIPYSIRNLSMLVINTSN